MSRVDIKVSLEDPTTINDLYRIFNLMVNNFDWLNHEFLRQSLLYLEERAKFHIDVTTHMQTGDLKSHFKRIITKDVGELFNNSMHAVFVEFGTGMVGAKSKHPDANGFAFRKTGWTYRAKDGMYYHTNGQAAHKYMYNAFNDYYYKGGYIECFVKAFDVFMEKKVNKGRKHKI